MGSPATYSKTSKTNTWPEQRFVLKMVKFEEPKFGRILSGLLAGDLVTLVETDHVVGTRN